jgi:histidinol-phosphate aminotransferase
MGDLKRSTCDFIELATEGVKGLHPYQPGKPIEELERELGLTEIVKLASNENPLGISPLASAAIQQALKSAALYPDGTGFVLKQALADYLNVATSTITLGNGSNDVLELITRAYASAESQVIYSQFAFAVYALSTQSVNAKAVVVPANDWGHDLDAMFAAITEQTSLIFIANPNNPTGTYLSSSKINYFLSRVPENIIVVLDEAYCEYIDNSDYPNGISLLKDYPNLVVTRTLSKAWGLASLRVGYAISNPDVANILNRVRQPFNVNSFALAAAAAVLSDEAYLEKGKRINKEGLTQIGEGLASLGLSYIPSVGNFICFKVVEEGEKVYQALLTKGVIVRPLANYGMPYHLRVSIGLKSENQRFLDALASVL